MADRRLKFFNKKGNPINFEYIGPTGPTPLNYKLYYRTSNSSSSQGLADLTDLDTSLQATFNVKDNRGFDILSWANEIDYFLSRGAEVDVTIKILPLNSFKGKVSSVSITSSSVTVSFSSYLGQNIVTTDKSIVVECEYRYRPGGYFYGKMFFDPVSSGLYENEQIFALQEVYSPDPESKNWELQSSFPSIDPRYLTSLPLGDGWVMYAGGTPTVVNSTSAKILRTSDNGQTIEDLSSYIPPNTYTIYGMGSNNKGGSQNVILFAGLFRTPTYTSITRLTGDPKTSTSFSSANYIPPVTSSKYDLRDVSFTESGGDIAIAVGRIYPSSFPSGSGNTTGARILRSVDSGLNFVNRAVPSGVSSELSTVKFHGGTGFILGDNNTALFSSDHGFNWTKIEVPGISTFFKDGFLHSSGLGWGCGTNGAIIRTENFGQSWIRVDSGVNSTIESIYFSDNLNGWATTSNGSILRTTNSGFLWNIEAKPISGSLNTVIVNPDLDVPGFIAGEYSSVISSTGEISGLNYTYPRAGSTGGSGPSIWRTRWDSDNYGDVDVSEIIFTYKIEDELEGSDGYPLIISYPNIAIPLDRGENDYYSNGFLNIGSTASANSQAVSINVAINANDLYADVYERKLIVEDLSSGLPEKVLEIDFCGEIVGEDERFSIMLQNVGRLFTPSDANILRNSDPEEPIPNYLEINEKRKELLLEGDQIYNYVGAYKGLINALRFFGYQDLRVKEYWLNLSYRTVDSLPAIQKTQAFLNQYNRAQKKYTQDVVISDILDNPNSGKYRLEQTYGPDKDGVYRLDVSSGAALVPSRTYKKTSLFGLYYDLNKVTDSVDEFGYPVVEDAFIFTIEEILIKLFALKERLKKTYLPLNARIIDITGEGVYFTVYNTKAWTDSLLRTDINSGFYLDLNVNPDFGFIEDLRAFSIRPTQPGVQTPQNYNAVENIDVYVMGSTGSMINYGSGGFIFENLSTGATGINPPIDIVPGKKYIFNLKQDYSTIPLDDLEIDGVPFSFNVGYSGGYQLSSGVEGNGTTGGSQLIFEPTPGITGGLIYYAGPTAYYPNIKGDFVVNQPLISDFGNQINPLTFLQAPNAGSNQEMISAISEFYEKKENGEVVSLGDSLQDPTFLVDPSTGQIYKNPLGMPVILELLTDVWSWSEMTTSWTSLNIPVAKIDDFVFVREYQDVSTGGLTGGWYGTVVDVNFSTGEYTLENQTGNDVVVGSELIVSPTQEFLLLTWQNIDFSNMIEIEWNISKMPGEPGLPYFYEFRGDILSYYKFAHFLPSTGKYKVVCHVYDAFNAKTTVIKNSVIEVSPITIDIDAWTRYRENEYYIWPQVYRPWDSYNSIWDYPAEGLTYEETTKEIPQELLDYASYGNNVEEGQSMYVGYYPPPIGATGSFNLSQDFIQITSIVSLEILPGTYGFAEVTTSVDHNLSTFANVYISGSRVSEINGNWDIEVTGSNKFYIPLSLTPNLSNVTVTPGTSVTANLSGNEIVSYEGSVSVYVNDILIGSTEAGETLYQTSNYIVSAINNTLTYPDYYASCLSPDQTPSIITIEAPSETGSQYNGALLRITVTGSLSVSNSTGELSGGTGSYLTYEYWNETSDDLPDTNLKYWGAKRLVWKNFEESTWSQSYAHSWEDLSFNNDWIGGFEIHNVSSGDYLKVSPASDVFPFATGLTFTSSVPGALTLGEAVNQLNNSSDENITNFYYRISPQGTNPNLLANTSNPLNQNAGSVLIPASNLAVPTPRR